VRRVRTAKPAPVTTVKSRIAGALGLTSPPKGCTIPMQKLKTDKSTEFGASTLSIFGNRDELHHFEE